MRIPLAIVAFVFVAMASPPAAESGVDLIGALGAKELTSETLVVYLPNYAFVGDAEKSSAWTQKFMAEFTELFGGVTVVEGRGLDKDAQGTVNVARTTIVYAHLDPSVLTAENAARLKVFFKAFCRDVGTDFLFFAYDGRLCLMPAE